MKPTGGASGAQSYRIEAGVCSRCVVGQVDTRDGIIVETPRIWRRFKGQSLQSLEWWLAAKYGTVQKRRME